MANILTVDVNVVTLFLIYLVFFLKNLLNIHPNLYCLHFLADLISKTGAIPPFVWIRYKYEMSNSF